MGTNFRGDKINMGEMIMGSIGYSLIWVVDEEKAPVGLPYVTAFYSPTVTTLFRILRSSTSRMERALQRWMSEKDANPEVFLGLDDYANFATLLFFLKFMINSIVVM